MGGRQDLVLGGGNRLRPPCSPPPFTPIFQKGANLDVGEHGGWKYGPEVRVGEGRSGVSPLTQESEGEEE